VIVTIFAARVFFGFFLFFWCFSSFYVLNYSLIIAARRGAYQVFNYIIFCFLLIFTAARGVGF
jgi:hypothetical protein